MSIFTNSASTSREEAAAYTAAILDLLGTRDPMYVLRATVSGLPRAVAGLTEAEEAAPEAPGKWSVRQVVQHLADAELVCGYRVRMVLAHDRPVITGYDQDLWATRLRYDQANLTEALEEFATLRRANLRLIDRSSAEDLARLGIHAERGEETVAHMLRMCAGHDLLHLRQIERIRHAVAPRG